MNILKFFFRGIIFTAMTLIISGNYNLMAVEGPNPAEPETDVPKPAGYESGYRKTEALKPEDAGDKDPGSEKPQPVAWQDVAGWKYIPGGSVTVSNEGQWFAYWYSPNKGNSELILQNITGDTRKVFSIGETSGGGGNAIEFSHDSRFIAFMVYPTEGENAPGWLKEGIPLLEMKKHLEERPAVLNVQ